MRLVKKLGKAIGRSEAVRRAACWILAQYIRLAHGLGRWEVEGGAFPARYWDEGKPFILCFWHGRLLMMPYCWRRDKVIHMLISAHRDGQLIADTVAHFGIKTAAGSSTRGGAGALRVILKALKAGDYVGITPDGPRGPRMRVGGGIIDVARLSGAPILPATYSSRRGRFLGSWDRFRVVWPGSNGLFLWGEPLYVSRDADIEATRQTLEERMNALCAEADRRCGQKPVEPADQEE